MIVNPYSPATFFAAVDGATDKTSDVINILGYPNQGLQFSWTGTLTGTLAILVSTTNDIATAQSLTLTGLTPAFNQPAGSPGSQRIDIGPLNSAYMWVTYTAVSGTGTLTGSVVVNP